MVAFSESGEGARGGPIVYLRETNGAPAVTLGQGVYPSFAPDEQSVVAVNGSSIFIYPVGPGETKHLSLPHFNIRAAGLLPDGRRIWFNGNEGSHAVRLYLTDIYAATPRALSPEGVQSARVSLVLADKYLAGRSRSGLRLYPVDGGDSLPVPTAPDEVVSVAGSAADGRTLFLASLTIPSKIYRLDVKTGKADVITEAAPPDRAGILGGMIVQMTPDGNSYAYSYPQELSELQWIEGLR